MNNQDPSQDDFSMDSYHESRGLENKDPSLPGTINQSNNPAQPVQPAQKEYHDADKEMNKVVDDNRTEVNSSQRHDSSTKETSGNAEPLLKKGMVDDLRNRWNVIQLQFVDSPCSAIEQGDTLIAEVIEEISQSLSNIQNSLDQQWLNHDEITTEELRIVLQNYRSILNRLLTF